VAFCAKKKESRVLGGNRLGRSQNSHIRKPPGLLRRVAILTARSCPLLWDTLSCSTPYRLTTVRRLAQVQQQQPLACAAWMPDVCMECSPPVVRLLLSTRIDMDKVDKLRIKFFCLTASISSPQTLRSSESFTWVLGSAAQHDTHHLTTMESARLADSVSDHRRGPIVSCILLTVFCTSDARQACSADPAPHRGYSRATVARLKCLHDNQPQLPIFKAGQLNSSVFTATGRVDCGRCY
jgi:hypothetical protein